MFKLTRTFLLFEMLIITLPGADPSSSNIENSLAAVKLDVEILLDFMKDLRAKLGSSFEWPPSKNVMCPPGFTYLPSAAKCYKVVYESHDWYSAGKKCQGLHRGSHLAAITSATENNAVKTFLASELSKNVGNTACIASDVPSFGNLFWTSGQRLIENNCWSPFVWKPSKDERLSFQFVSWRAGQPDCHRNVEFCVHFWPIHNFGWNDIWCSARICPLCEYNP